MMSRLSARVMMRTRVESYRRKFQKAIPPLLLPYVLLFRMSFYTPGSLSASTNTLLPTMYHFESFFDHHKHLHAMQDCLLEAFISYENTNVYAESRLACLTRLCSHTAGSLVSTRTPMLLNLITCRSLVLGEPVSLPDSYPRTAPSHKARMRNSRQSMG